MGITDGSFICGLCGEDRNGCYLCSNPPMIDVRKMRYDELQAEQELAAQTRAIRRAADIRQGWKI